MFQKIRLKNKISKCKKEIERIEQKRFRSQSALVQAILTKSTPSDEDVDYFNNYTKQIDDVRNQMTEYQIKLKNI